MKKFLLSMLLLIVGIPSFAQKGQIELSLYGGSLSYHKTENSYYGTFSSGFELGFQSKYFLTNRVFGAVDLFGGTDDGTENKISTQNGDRILSLSRCDYSVTTGVGVNFVATKRLQAYIQALGGIGRVEGYTSDYISEKVGFERNDLNRTSYLLSAGIGIDFSISKNWKIGGGYSFRYLGGVDGSNAIFARISYVIP